MKIYFDNCCLNRMLDDQVQDRVRIETEAIVAIINMCYNKIIDMYGSEILEYEISRIKDEAKRSSVFSLYFKIVSYIIETNDTIQNRANELEKFNFKE